MKFKMEECFQNLTEIPESFDFSLCQGRVFQAHFNDICFGEGNKPLAAG